MNRSGWATVVLGLASLIITGCTHPAAHPVPPARGSPTPVRSAADPATGRPQPFPRDLPAGAPRGLTPAQQRVDRRSADAVAAAFVVRLELWDSALDRRPNDAARRAAAYATPRFRSEMLAGEPDGLPGERWNALVSHHGWTTVTARLGGLGQDPPTTATSAMRAVTPVPVDHGTDGWTSYPGPPGTYIVVLDRAGKGRPWSVNSYAIQ